MSRALPTVQRRLLDYPGLAAYLSISLRSAKQLAHDGKIPKVLIGSRVLFDVDDVNVFVEKTKRAS